MVTFTITKSNVLNVFGILCFMFMFGMMVFNTAIALNMVNFINDISNGDTKKADIFIQALKNDTNDKTIVQGRDTVHFFFITENVLLYAITPFMFGLLLYLVLLKHDATDLRKDLTSLFEWLARQTKPNNTLKKDDKLEEKK